MRKRQSEEQIIGVLKEAKLGQRPLIFFEEMEFRMRRFISGEKTRKEIELPVIQEFNELY